MVKITHTIAHSEAKFWEIFVFPNFEIALCIVF